MNECIMCNASVDETPLYRAGEMGKDPEWMCENCLENFHPEKHRQLDNEMKELVEILQPNNQ